MSKRREKLFSCQTTQIVKTARDIIDGAEKYMVYRRCRLDLLIEKYIQSLNLNGL
jgi:hypothetical protein